MTGEGWWPRLGFGRNPVAGCNRRRHSFGLVGRSRLRSRRHSHLVAAGRRSRLRSPAGRRSRHRRRRRSRRHPKHDGGVKVGNRGSTFWSGRFNLYRARTKTRKVFRSQEKKFHGNAVACGSITSTRTLAPKQRQKKLAFYYRPL